MEEEEEIEEMNQIQPLPWLVDSILFCYKRETHTGNDSEIKQHFIHHKGKRNNKESYTDGSMSTGGKVGFADITRRGTLPEVSIHTAEMTMRDIKKRGHEMNNIYRLAELNAGQLGP